MFKDFLYNLWIFNRGNNIYLAPTLLTLLYFYGEDPLQALRPCHRISLVPRLILHPYIIHGLY